MDVHECYVANTPGGMTFCYKVRSASGPVKYLLAYEDFSGLLTPWRWTGSEVERERFLRDARRDLKIAKVLSVGRLPVDLSTAQKSPDHAGTYVFGGPKPRRKRRKDLSQARGLVTTSTPEA